MFSVQMQYNHNLNMAKLWLLVFKHGFIHSEPWEAVR